MNYPYSFQYTLISMPIRRMGRHYGIMLALTDFASDKHHYTLITELSDQQVPTTNTVVQWDDPAGVVKAPHSMKIWAEHPQFGFDLEMSW